MSIQDNGRLDALLATHGNTPGSLWVGDVVPVEAVWTLRSAWAQGQPAQFGALRSRLSDIAFAFDDRDTVERAGALFERTSCGFADCLTVARAARGGCDFTATFDRGMKRLPGARVV